MDKDSALFPSIPSSTVLAARALYGRGNVYLRLGDRLNYLVSKFDHHEISAQLGAGHTLLLALLTIIQYVEKLTDAELAASIQQRMDLRYALHLATPSPRLDPQALCDFRSQLLRDAQSACLFGEIFHFIYPEITSNTMKEELTVNEVLNSICENEVRMALIEAMLRSVEALSATHFNWLRRIALPHWYQRYNRSMLVANSNHSHEKQELTREDVQGDIQHLLYEIHESNSQEIMKMHEIRELSLTCEQLTNSTLMKDCNHCIKMKY